MLVFECRNSSIRVEIRVAVCFAMESTEDVFPFQERKFESHKEHFTAQLNSFPDIGTGTVLSQLERPEIGLIGLSPVESTRSSSCEHSSGTRFQPGHG